MTINNKLYKGILAMAGILVLLAYGLSLYLNLKEPVFLEHTYYLNLDSTEEITEVSFNLTYITNSDDNRAVVGASFPEYPDLFIQASEQYYDRTDRNRWDEPYPQENEMTYGRFRIKTVYLQIRDFMDEDEWDDTVINQATLTFDDDSEMTVDIGAIHLNTEQETESLAEMISGINKSEGVSDVMYRIHDDISISIEEGQNSELRSLASEIRLNDVDYTDAKQLDIMEGESLTIVTVPRQYGNSPYDYEMRNFIADVTYKTSDGTSGQLRLPTIGYQHPDYTFIDLYRYLRGRGEL